MKARKYGIVLSTLFIIITIRAQNLTQTVRGIVIDKISQSPLPGAAVILLESNPMNGSTTDGEGRFKLLNVPVGKQSLKVSFLGYKNVTLSSLSVNAGKELVLTIQMEEDITVMAEIEVKANVDKNKPLNELSTVSTRAFSVEETQRFAGAFNDPARMAASFAGVVQAGDGNNHISIRGNSPNGLLWRMEGVEIPNPNHFSGVGTSGGGISILSSQLLGNSDFSTGAFAAEYGNALSGVFDLKLRKGNNQKREYTLQAGLLGADVSFEGPFRKNYEGSYLVNYRYSTLSLLGKIGVSIGDAITNFQDLSLNISLPTKKLGTFGVFGFGGISYQDTKAETDTASWREDSFTRYNSHFFANTGAIGLTHTKLFDNHSYLRTALVLSGTQNGYNQEKLEDDLVTYTRDYQESYTQNKITLSSVYTKKISARSNIRTGIILNRLGYNLLKKDISDTSALTTKISNIGNTQTGQVFFQWNQKINDKLTTNVGLHYFHLFLNNSWSLEPRASVKYDIHQKHQFALGYGLHSQLQPIGTYFIDKINSDGTIIKPNKNLQLSKAHHIVMGYDWKINEYSHIKTEIYYQHLFNVPISTNKNSTYSLLNSTEGFYTDKLENKGLGRNYGLELTYERFLNKNLYWLVSGSLYDSKYKAPNGVWYNTRFNTNYALTVTLGKEWNLKSERRNRVIGLNIKSVYVGGWRNTPIDMDKSLAKGETVFDESRTFELKNPDYYRLDLKISLKRNYRKVTTILALDIQNTTNRENVGGQYYDVSTGEIKYWYQAPIIPVLSFRVEF